MSRYKPSSVIASFFGLNELVNNPMSGVSSAMRDFLNPDLLSQKSDIFSATVISMPKTIEPYEYEALGKAAYDTKMDQGIYKKFKVRINEKVGNPHALLQDPCDITLAKDKCEQNALVAAHTTVLTTHHRGINIGTHVRIKLHKYSDNTYNLETAELFDVMAILPNETGETTLSAKSCDTIKTYFKFGEAYIPPPPIQMPSELRTLAELYDATPDIPGKNVALIAGFKPHKTYVEGGGPPAFKKPFNIWVKALIYLAYEQGFSVQITSAYRTQAQQEKLHKDYLEGRRKLPAACGTCSRHISGFAVDLNFYDVNGTLITSSYNKAQWLMTGFPQIGMGPPLFLTWGGNFSPKYYDPVHFELNPKNWGDNVDQFFEEVDQSNHNLDTLSTDASTRGERGAHETGVIGDPDAPEALRAFAESHAEADADIAFDSTAGGGYIPDPSD